MDHQIACFHRHLLLLLSHRPCSRIRMDRHIQLRRSNLKRLIDLLADLPSFKRSSAKRSRRLRRKGLALPTRSPRPQQSGRTSMLRCRSVDRILRLASLPIKSSHSFENQRMPIVILLQRRISSSLLRLEDCESLWRRAWRIRKLHCSQFRSDLLLRAHLPFLCCLECDRQAFLVDFQDSLLRFADLVIKPVGMKVYNLKRETLHLFYDLSPTSVIAFNYGGALFFNLRYCKSLAIVIV